MNKKFWATAFTLSGTIIGAGILGLPYIFSRSGFLIGLVWLIALGAIMTYTNLCLGEVTLRTSGRHQLSGYAQKYFGKKGKRLMFFAMIFGVYSALLAYLIGEGQSLSQLLPGEINPFILGVLFWLIMTLILKEGLRGIKKAETLGVIVIIALILGIFFFFFSSVNYQNLLTMDAQNIGLPIGVILFSLLGFTALPELRVEIKGQERLLKKAIIIGSLVPIVLYILFTFVFVGVLGQKVSEVATLSFGPIVTVLGIFTMMTAYIIHTYALKDAFRYDLHFNRFQTFFFSSIVPLIFYVLITLVPKIGFSKILGIGGVISGGLTGILILLINKKAKTHGNKKSEIDMPINWPIIILLTTIFIAGIVIELIN